MAAASPREIRFDWYWKADEQVRAGRAMRPYRKAPRWLVPAGWALVAILCSAPVLIGQRPVEERATLACTLLAMLIACARVLMRIRGGVTDRAHAFKEPPYSYAGIADQLKAMDMKHPITARISDEGYSTTSYTGLGRHAWTYFRGARETDEFLLLLFAGDGGGYYLPKRAVPADDLEAIRGILHRHIGEQAWLMDAPASDPHLHHAAGRVTQAIGGPPEMHG